MSQPIKPLTKIAPKPSTSGITTVNKLAAPPAGKYVIIQSGMSMPLKMVSGPKPGTSSSPVEQPRPKFVVKNGSQQIKAEKVMSNVVVAPASAITIGKKPDGQATMIKMQKPETNVVRVMSAPQTTPNYHKVNIPGKGVQVVRLLNSQAPGTSQPVASSTPKQLTRLVTPQSQQQQMQQRVLNDGSVVVRNMQAPQRTFPVNKQQMVQRIATQPEKKYITIHQSGGKQVELVKKEPNEQSALRMQGGPPAKKTKYITLTTSQINQIQGATIMSGNGNKKKIVMLPANYIEQLEKLSKNSNNGISHPNQTTFKIVNNLKKEDTEKKKRACNCTRSQCLKFYCDCFANGEFCQNCNCKDCQNVEDSAEREKAVKLCLERNPAAFKPKIQVDKAERAHTKGCNCKRSGCLKNYCECYEGKIQCSDNCRCLGCKNVEDVQEKQQQELNYLKISNKRQSFSDDSISDIKLLRDGRGLADPGSDSESMKKPYNFMTQDVIEATVQCMIAQGEECQKLAVSKKQHEKMILEEFGRCLVEIIDFSNKNLD